MTTKHQRVNGRSRYSFTSSGGRTSNEVEAQVAERLEAEGWEVLKNGWPDFLAYKDGKIRLIEVKPHGGRHLSPRQQHMAEIMKEVFGLDVEIHVGETG